MQHAWKVVTAFVGVFIAGSVFGGLFAIRIGQTITERRADAVTTVQLFNRYRNRLNLTDEQSKQLEPVLKQAETDLARARDNELKESFTIVQRQHQAIRSILTEEQKAQLQGMEDEMRARGGFADGRGGRGGPGRGGPNRGGRRGGPPSAGGDPQATQPSAPQAPEEAPQTPPEAPAPN